MVKLSVLCNHPTDLSLKSFVGSSTSVHPGFPIMLSTILNFVRSYALIDTLVYAMASGLFLNSKIALHLILHLSRYLTRPSSLAAIIPSSFCRNQGFCTNHIFSFLISYTLISHYYCINYTFIFKFKVISVLMHISFLFATSPLLGSVPLPESLKMLILSWATICTYYSL